nr:hypothetical protein [Tanacetum cinerariifolium]
IPLAVQLSSAAHAVLTTRPACCPSLISCLPSLEESLTSVSNAYAVAVAGVSGAKTRMRTPSPGEFEAQNRLHDSILSSEPKPLV